MDNPLSPMARRLGYAGLLPQAYAVLMAAAGGEWRWSALAIGYGYAALIFSFLGGVWWGLGLSRPAPPRWVFVAAVLPSLIALATYLPWIWGLAWPQPSLAVIGVGLLASPLVDRAIGMPQDWMRLRWHLSIGLGGMTLVLALI